MEKVKNTQKTGFRPFDGFIDPPHKVEVSVIGAGGTGSQVLQGLARINHALENLNHPGLFVTVYDHDTVEEPNIGRQLFSMNDLGRNKAECLVSKINRFYGYSWESVPEKFDPIIYRPYNSVFMTCVDNVALRHEFYERWKTYDPLSSTNEAYWMDFGNGKTTGQVVMGNLKINDQGESLQCIGDIGIPEKDDDDSPSCSLAEALSKQDLMINTMVANAGLAMFWQIFRTLKISYNVAYVNLDKMKINSTLKLKSNESKKAKKAIAKTQLDKE